MNSMYESLIARFNKILEKYDIKIVSKINEDNKTKKIYIVDIENPDKIISRIWLSAYQMFFDDKNSLCRYCHDAYVVKNHLEFEMNFGFFAHDEYKFTIRMANAYNGIMQFEKCKSIDELMLEMDLMGI